ncbi:MAG: M15 family metallopeptidase [Deltaproteobacteria bacterium]|nr:M15 family metallopeptidase [Deltaproteobacteria bacterium]
MHLLFLLALAAAPDGFAGNHAPIDEMTKKMMTASSWKEGCPVPFEDLALVNVKHWGFDNKVHDGQLVVAAAVAPEIVEIFSELYAAKFPIESMRLIDEFGADDDRSMDANNTTAFNCRPMTGKSTGFSKHSYGRAIDINPKTNPYVAKTLVSPKSGEAYVDRTKTYVGGIVENGVCERAFVKRGWAWGGAWKSPKDYQHFEKAAKKGK